MRKSCRIRGLRLFGGATSLQRTLLFSEKTALISYLFPTGRSPIFWALGIKIPNKHRPNESMLVDGYWWFRTELPQRDMKGKAENRPQTLRNCVFTDPWIRKAILPKIGILG